MIELIVPLILLSGIFLSIALFLKPRFTLYLVTFSCIFDLAYFSRWFGLSRYFARLTYFLAAILAASFISHFLIRKYAIIRKAKLIKATLILIIILFALTIISLLINQGDVLLGIYELRYYFILIVLCIGFYKYRPSFLTEPKLIQSIVIIGLIQIPVTAIQNFFTVGLRASSSNISLDISSGTFVSYPALVFYQCVALGLTLMYQIKTRRPILKINNYILIILLIIPLLLSFSRSAVGFVTIILLTVFLREIYIKKSLRFFLRTAVPISLLIFIVIFSFYEFFWKKHSRFEEQLNVNYVVGYFFREARDYHGYLAGSDPVMGRGRAFIYSFKMTSESFRTFLFGLGSGSTSNSLFLGRVGNFYYRYGPEAGLGRIQYSKIIIEYGYLGLFVFITYFLYLLNQIKKARIKMRGSLCYDVFFVVLLSIVLLSFYSTILHNEITILILAGVITSAQIRMLQQ